MDEHSSLKSAELEPATHSTFDVVLEYLQPAENPAMLGRLGGYEILEVVGQGGMGLVLKGYDRELNRHVAVKVLAPHFAGSAAARQRFAREAQAAAAVVHAHVIPIHAVDVSGPLPYLVMPYIAGQSLEQHLQEHGPIALREILRIGLQAADGLAAAHAQGLVHRDIKPANILLEKGVNRVLLTDFGLARAVDDASLTRSGVIAGTPQYMSPEQARGDAVDCRSDLFSLGSVLYAMCTGFPPFRAETWMGVLRRITDSPTRSVPEINPDIPDWLELLIQQLHAKSPAARPQSAAEVARTLEQCLAHVQHPGANELPRCLQKQPAPKRHRVKRLTAAVMMCAVAILLAATAVLQWSRGDKTYNKNTTDATATKDSSRHSADESSSTASNAKVTAIEQQQPEPSPWELQWEGGISYELMTVDQVIQVLEMETHVED